MLDIQFILKHPDLVEKNTRERCANASVAQVIASHKEVKQLRSEIERVQRRQNQISGQFKNGDRVNGEQLQEEVRTLKNRLSELKAKLASTQKTYDSEMFKIPNLTAPDVPQGRDDQSNMVVKSFGEPTRFDFRPLDHVELGQRLSLVDFKSAARVCGSKFCFLKNEAVLLELGLIRFALDLAAKHGFMLMSTPDLARDEIIDASGFSPRGPEGQIYSLSDGSLSLIGTSEITIGGFMSQMVIPEKELPIKISGVSHCFRTEAGSSGRVSKGLFRLHQFSKVELFQFTHPDNSAMALEELLEIEEEIYQALGLPYRVVLVCKGDLGAPAFKKYDIEAWMPFIGETGGYGEVTSASNCTDFQARRLNTKFKRRDPGGKMEFVHTLNGTAIATTRTMLAIMENFQQADGSVLIPRVLRPYVGIEIIRPRD